MQAAAIVRAGGIVPLTVDEKNVNVYFYFKRDMSYILVVNSDSNFVAAAGKVLNDEGHSVLSAASVHRALEMVRAGLTGIDLALIDIGTEPDCIPSTRILSEDFGLPCIFLYGDADLPLLARTGSVASYGCLHKHSCPHALLAGVSSALQLHARHMEARRTAASLRSSEQQLRDLIERMPDGVYKSTHDGRFIDVNPAMVDILGYESKEELLAIDIKTQLYFTPTDRDSAALEEKLEEMAVFRLRKKDGSEVWVEDHGSHIVDEQGTVMFHQGVLRDVSERIRSERQLLQAQKLEGIGTLAGGIAHDFNNLLAMILGSAELLHRQTMSLPHLQKNINRIIQASERGTSISRQLLLFSRPDAAELRQISLSHTIVELEEMLRHFLPKSIAIRTEIDVENGMILGDSGQIHQALMNLALNASDAMDGKGMMTIREFSVDARNPHSASDGVPVPHIAVSVTDTGSGIDPALVAKIFDPFFSTKQAGKGTGLGLAIVHGIMKNHGGYIDVRSTPNVGSTFTLYFPAIAAEAHCAQSADEPAETTAHGTILLVDDEKLIRDMLVEFLEESGYSVLTAINGTEGMELYRTHKDEIDLVITDLGMPEIGGEELFHELKKIDSRVKVVVSSGYLDGSTKNDLIAIGVKDVLTKPYKFGEISRVIRRALAAD